ncbi:rhodanese-like domain-containing protein [Clostridiaceae bacterium M8S5]|nr:rhodanese-like domain-containing protein [Clostridiaceae bacterium M8S5]
MKKYTLIFIVVITLVNFSGCSKKTEGNNENNEGVKVGTVNNTYQTITPQEAKKMIDEDTNVQLLDVRTKQEYDENHIPSSILLPYDEIKDRAKSVLPNKDAKIIVYCRSGRRSKIASLELINMGYKNVYDLGGIIDWPYEVEK